MEIFYRNLLGALGVSSSDRKVNAALV